MSHQYPEVAEPALVPSTPWSAEEVADDEEPGTEIGAVTRDRPPTRLHRVAVLELRGVGVVEEEGAEGGAPLAGMEDWVGLWGEEQGGKEVVKYDGRWAMEGMTGMAMTPLRQLRTPTNEKG